MPCRDSGVLDSILRRLGVSALAEFMRDATMLALILWVAWNKPAAGEMQMIESARRGKDDRRIEFAQKYQTIVLTSLAHHSI